MGDVVARAAQRLHAAEASGVPTAPVRDLIGRDDLDGAYRVQQAVLERKIAAGRRRVGRKIGLTSPAVQRQMGVSQPDFGVLLDDMRYDHGARVRLARLLQPRAEAEIAFVLNEGLDDADASYERVAASIGYAVAAIEIVDSRIADWDITITDTVADNASSGAFVVGTPMRGLDEFTPRAARMTLTFDGVVVSEGSGEACLGDPILAVQWLSRTSIACGDPLRAGEIVLSGALGPLFPIPGPGALSAGIRGLGEVSVLLEGEVAE